MKYYRRDFCAAALAFACCVLASRAHAQAYPYRPITTVGAFPASSGADLAARAIAPGLLEVLGQPVVVENRAGAGGVIGARSVSTAQPDG